MPRVLIAFLVFAPVLTACADFPDLQLPSATASGQRGFPSLIAIDPTLLTARSDSQDAQLQAQHLAARVARLNARGRALRKPVIDRATRQRLAAAVRRHNR
ncbi:MAG: hypothetical protein V3U96_09475 [Paracoccaceae bacterium]